MAHKWNTADSLVGHRVTIYTEKGEEETAVVLAVSESGILRVKADDDGEILTGNQWEEI